MYADGVGKDADVEARIAAVTALADERQRAVPSPNCRAVRGGKTQL